MMDQKQSLHHNFHKSHTTRIVDLGDNLCMFYGFDIAGQKAQEEEGKTKQGEKEQSESLSSPRENKRKSWSAWPECRVICVKIEQKIYLNKATISMPFSLRWNRFTKKKKKLNFLSFEIAALSFSQRKDPSKTEEFNLTSETNPEIVGGG